MKTILIILFGLACTNVYAQQPEKLKASSTKFSPISQKILKIQTSIDLSKMKPSIGTALGTAKMKAANGVYLSFFRPENVWPEEVEFFMNEGLDSRGSELRIIFPHNSGGVYICELNVGLFHATLKPVFTITINGVTQSITLTNTSVAGQRFTDNKLIFAVTIPGTYTIVQIVGTSQWLFRNCEIIPMK